MKLIQFIFLALSLFDTSAKASDALDCNIFDNVSIELSKEKILSFSAYEIKNKGNFWPIEQRQNSAIIKDLTQLKLVDLKKIHFYQYIEIEIFVYPHGKYQDHDVKCQDRVGKMTLRNFIPVENSSQKPFLELIHIEITPKLQKNGYASMALNQFSNILDAKKPTDLYLICGNQGKGVYKMYYKAGFLPQIIKGYFYDTKVKCDEEWTRSFYSYLQDKTKEFIVPSGCLMKRNPNERYS